jgi:hypothetical protein
MNSPLNNVTSPQYPPKLPTFDSINLFISDDRIIAHSIVFRLRYPVLQK